MELQGFLWRFFNLSRFSVEFAHIHLVSFIWNGSLTDSWLVILRSHVQILGINRLFSEMYLINQSAYLSTYFTITFNFQSSSKSFSDSAMAADASREVCCY